MNSTQFTEQLHKLGYETTTDGGAIIIIGKQDSFDENLKEASGLVKEYGYQIMKRIILSLTPSVHLSR